MTPVELALYVVVTNMQLPKSCGYIPVPEVRCVNLAPYNRDGKWARGMYPNSGRIVYLDTSVCDDRYYLQHEVAHYVMYRCGMKQDEQVAHSAQFFD